MNQSDSTTATRLDSASSGLYGIEDRGKKYAPVVRTFATTRPGVVGQASVISTDADESLRKSFDPPLAREALPSDINTNSTPIQIWEGTVIDIDRNAGTMQATLDAKIGQIPQHTAEIELKWVDDQDQELVRPGAVFYLTLYMRARPSIENAQELRFRRRPTWSAYQIEQIQRDAVRLRSKIHIRPVADD